MLSIIFLLVLSTQDPKQPKIEPKVVETYSCIINREKTKNGNTNLYCGLDRNGERIEADIPVTEIRFISGDAFLFELLSDDSVRIAAKEKQPEGSKYEFAPPCKQALKDAAQVPCNPNLKEGN